MKNYPLIILAGGNGSRMGTPKGLIEFNGRPWLEQQLIRYKQTLSFRKVVVVLGHSSEVYLKTFSWLVQAQLGWIEYNGLNLLAVINPHPEKGQFSSLQCGLLGLQNEKYDGAFILPVDVPVARPEVWVALRHALTSDRLACIPVWENHGGHPVLLSNSCLKTLSEMPAESRLDVQLRILAPEKVSRVVVDDPCVCMNMNTPAQWKKFSSAELA